tara:strand:+ start:632 stop:913 length:282 start_codon:yes stop_codon:yes gene_type:complete
MRKAYYTNKIEWFKLKKQIRVNKEVVLHDNFIDKDGKKTNGVNGELIIDIDKNKKDVDFEKGKQLRNKLRNNTSNFTLDDLKEIIKLSLPKLS